MKCSPTVKIALKCLLSCYHIALSLSIFITGSVLLYKSFTFYNSAVAQVMGNIDLPGFWRARTKHYTVDVLITLIGFAGCFHYIAGSIQRRSIAPPPAMKLISIAAVVFFIQPFLMWRIERYASQYTSSTTHLLIQSIAKRYNNGSDNEAFTKTMDKLQTTAMCCGSAKPKDWAFTPLNDFHGNPETGFLPPNTTFATPDSCCVQRKRDLAVTYLHDGEIKSKINRRPCAIHQNGCSDVITKGFGDYRYSHDTLVNYLLIAQVLALASALIVKLVAKYTPRQVDNGKANVATSEKPTYFSATKIGSTDIGDDDKWNYIAKPHDDTWNYMLVKTEANKSNYTLPKTEGHKSNYMLDKTEANKSNYMLAKTEGHKSITKPSKVTSV